MSSMPADVARHRCARCTGEPVANAVIDTVLERDADALFALARLEEHPCVEEPEHYPPPPQAPPTR